MRPLRLFGTEFNTTLVARRVVALDNDYDVATAYVAWRPGDLVTAVMGIRDYRDRIDRGLLPLDDYTVTELGSNVISDEVINNVVVRVRENFNALVDSMYRLATYPVGREFVKAWVRRMDELLRIDIHVLCIRAALPRYGMNALAILAALACLVRRLSSSEEHMDIAMALTHQANELLKNPINYMRSIRYPF